MQALLKYTSAIGLAAATLIGLAAVAAPNDSTADRPVQVIPDPKQGGGESDGVVQVANLIYAGTKSSKCFSDHFLVQAEQESSISTSPPDFPSMVI